MHSHSPVFGLTITTSRHPLDNFGNNWYKTPVICLLIRLRTTALLLTLVLIEIPILVLGKFSQVLAGIGIEEGWVGDRGFKALRVK